MPTSKKIGKLAAKTLRSPTASKTTKRLAGAALEARRGHKKGK